MIADNLELPFVTGWAEQMTNARKELSPQAQAWAEARKRYHLSQTQVQMARELGLNPRKLGKIANHGQEPWKAPLPQFIEDLYVKRFGRERPQAVVPAKGAMQQTARKDAGENAD